MIMMMMTMAMLIKTTTSVLFAIMLTSTTVLFVFVMGPEMLLTVTMTKAKTATQLWILILIVWMIRATAVMAMSTHASVTSLMSAKKVVHLTVESTMKRLSRKMSRAMTMWSVLVEQKIITVHLNLMVIKNVVSEVYRKWITL